MGVRFDFRITPNYTHKRSQTEEGMQTYKARQGGTETESEKFTQKQ